jgi:predicted NBD/HSP70 family sugar kinase
MQRAINRSLVLQQLHRQQRVSRSKLAALTGLNKATVTAVVQELLDASLVAEVGAHQGAVGRPAVQLAFHRTAHLIGGVQLDTGHLRAVLANLLGEVVGHWEEPVDPGASMEAIETQLVALATLTYNKAQEHNSTLLGIGLALPGMVDVEAGLLLRSDNLGWRDVPIRAALAKRTGCPIYIEKSTNVALLAEVYFGAARGASDALYIEVSDHGIGGAILVGGELYAGGTHLAGEVGHMRLIPDGPRCACGGRGCWETVASEAAIVRHAHRLWAAESPGGPIPSSISTVSNVREAARSGDPLARESLRQTGDWLGQGLANLVNVLGPELVVVGGALPIEEQLVWDAMMAAFGTNTLQQIALGCHIVTPHFGVDESAMGGAALVLRELIRHPAVIPSS